VNPDGTLGAFPPYTSYGSDATGLSFLSYTWPHPAWAVGVFRTELTRFSIRAEPDAIEGPGNFREIAPREIRADLAIEVYGVAGAWRATPTLWIGAAVTAQRYDYDAHQLDRRDGHRQWGQHATGEDTAMDATVGLLWKPAPAWRVGAAYRGGAALDAEYAFTCGTRGTGARPAICRNQGIPDGEPVPSLSGRTTFDVPDVWTVGVAYAFSDTVTASLQWDRVEYSDLGDGLRNSLTVITDLAGYSIPDADDLHFGVEALRQTGSGRVLALRFGAWLEQQHSLRYRGGIAEDPRREEVAVALFSTPIDDEWHGTAGLGFTLAGRWQLDAAADFSKYRDTYTLSTVVRF
jgi:long-subunit fatty acid transport protein